MFFGEGTGKHSPQNRPQTKSQVFFFEITVHGNTTEKADELENDENSNIMFLHLQYNRSPVFFTRQI